MLKNVIEDRALSSDEMDQGLLALASLAAEKLGITLPLFVNQALHEKLLKLSTELGAEPPESAG